MSKSVIFAIFGAVVVLLSAPLPILAQQTTATDVGQKMAEAGEAIKDYTIDKKAEAVTHAKKLGRDIDAKIKELEARASKGFADAYRDLAMSYHKAAAEFEK